MAGAVGMIDDLAGAEAAYRSALGGVPLLELDLTPLDRTGLPTVSVQPADARGGPIGTGFGAELRRARVGALGELAEGLLTEPVVARTPVEEGSYARLRRRYGPDGVCDPRTLGLTVGTVFDEDAPRLWATATRWRTGEPVRVPVEFLASYPATLEERWPGRDWLAVPVTNGLGAGRSPAAAVEHGLLELVQRDGTTVDIRALNTGRVLDLDGFAEPGVRAAVGRLRAAGIEPLVTLAADEFLPVVCCVGSSTVEEAAPIASSGMGEGAHPDLATAVEKALLEFAGSRARRTFAHGGLDHLARWNPGYVDAVRRTAGLRSEERALAAMVTWCGLSTAQLREQLDPLFVRTDTVAPAAVRRPPSADVLELLAGFDVLALTTEGPVATAKALVPGLEVETLSYFRLGERVARRLLDRGSPLVGLGLGDGAARLRACLPAAAEERLGGPVWFDVAEADRVVGGLYPLYREPTRHHAPLVAERGAPAR